MRARAAATKNGRRRSPERVIAVFSDIHSNLEALQAVLEDMEAHGVTERFCLGDIVGYNADPALCLDVVRRLDCPVIQGNHDREGAEDEPLFGYRELARISMQHTRDRLSDEQKRWLRGLPLILEDPDFTLVHGSLFEPKEFFYVDSILEAEFHFANQQKQLCFCGHTHIARVFAQADIAEDLFLEEEAELRLEDGLKYLVNVGSVGQPRDRDWRASYVLYYPDSRRILYRRVQYDVGKAQQKINAAGLPAALGERILVGV
ncbi:MAG: metallophosphoesterase family protein [Verrucomicrobiota bacterium]